MMFSGLTKKVLLKYNFNILLRGYMKFEYDEKKSKINKEKHGIDFIDAQNLWIDESALIVPANLIDEEVRYALISKFKNKCYVAIFVLRDNVYRIISVRRCRKKEEESYEKNRGYNQA